MKVFSALALFASLAVVGCSVKVLEATTTHKQVMDQFVTKDQIIKKFGLPTSKKNEGEYEEWLYDYGTKTVTDAAAVGSSYAGTRSTAGVIGAAVAGRTTSGNPAVVGAATGGAASNSAANSSAKSRTITQDFKTFIKFTLQGDKVVTWASNGVDYSTYQKVRKRLSELR
jgi:hypothetical protein